MITDEDKQWFEDEANRRRALLSTGPEAARNLLAFLPNSERGAEVRRIVQDAQAGVIPRDVAWAALEQGWDHDHDEVVAAFGNRPLNLDDAFRELAPKHSLEDPVIVAYRGVRLEQPAASSALGLSWTLSPEIAAYFATLSPTAAPGLPVVFRAEIPREDILASIHTRNEREVIVDRRALVVGAGLGMTVISVEGRTRRLRRFGKMRIAPTPDEIARWTDLGRKYNEAKNAQNAAMLASMKKMVSVGDL